VIPFSPQDLYMGGVGLNDLDKPFSKMEIQKTAQQLARNKASNLDSLPNKFL
jgi:hypothetical protein